MPEAFPDPASKWTPVPDWSAARLARSDWRAAPAGELFRALVTGDLEAALASLNPRSASVGLWDIAPGPLAAIRIGRDRALLVASAPAATPWGWRPGGWAVSDASDAYKAFDITGPALRQIVAEATSANVEGGSPSAAIQFAGVPGLLYRIAADQARLHVETALAPYVWRWLETR
jgi:hypothetical protein